jgi:hypothetical protein
VRSRPWWVAPAVLVVAAVPLVLGGSWLLRPKDRPAGGQPSAAGRPDEQVRPLPTKPPTTSLRGDDLTPAAVRLDERTRSVPAGEVLKVVFEGAPPAPDKAVGPLRLQVGLYARRAGETAYRPLIDGDPLASQVDRYWVGIRPQADGFLYVFQVDSQGRADWLFPANRLAASSGSNPVKASDVIQIPPAEKTAFYLDTHTGAEHLYVVFSATRWPALEEALARPALPAAAVPPAFAVADRPLVGATRGVGGVTADEPPPPFERVTEGGRERLTLAARTFEGGGPVLVVERWFRHVAP